MLGADPGRVEYGRRSARHDRAVSRRAQRAVALDVPERGKRPWRRGLGDHQPGAIPAQSE